MSSIHESVYLAEGSRIIDNVTIGEDSAVWYNAVVRGDETPIRIGKRSNIQDNAVIHMDYGRPVVIGKNVTVGHSAIVHGAVVGDRTTVGMGAILMNGSRIGEDCIIGAGALVTQNVEIPPRSLVVGSPGKVIREVKPEEMERMRQNNQSYIEEARSLMHKK